MRRSFLKIGLVVSAALLASACARGPVDPDTGQAVGLAEVPDLKFVAGDFNNKRDAAPKPVNDFSDEDFRNVLSVLDRELCNDKDTLDACVQKFTQAVENKSNFLPFQGLSGITADALLRTAASGKTTAGKRDTKVKGQILPQCLHDRSLAGYHYDKKTKRLRLCVYMETVISRPKNKKNKIRYQYFHVEASHARVDKKTGRGGNVFPVAAKATGLKVSEDTAKGFDLKLYAAGRNIKVVSYWEANARSSFSRPIWTKYANGQTGIPKRIADYFRTDPDACIDMMFPNPSVPSTLPPGVIAGQHYCLGRCKNPPIVNTK